jgi:XrtN system VIT domain protein
MHLHTAELLDQHSAGPSSVIRYNPLKDKVYLVGLLLLVLSAAAFVFGISDDAINNRVFTTFSLQYGLVWVYTLVLWISRRLRWWAFGASRADYPVFFLLLLLWLISCFTLNREMRLFQPSAAWLEWYLVGAGAAYIAYAWKDRMAQWGRYLLWAALSAALMLFLYYALALIPLSLLGVAMVWFFGISLHALIPLVFCIYTLIVLYRAIQEEPQARIAVFSGIAAPLSIVITVASAWYQVSSRLADQVVAINASDAAELPRWVAVSRHLEPSWLNGYLLKAVAEQNLPVSNGILGEFFSPAFGRRENDPILQIAGAVSPRPALNADECRKIYAAQYNARNLMEERLWSDDDLITSEVQTSVMLDPAHRLSYTEKILTVAQKKAGNSGRTATQEAIYTLFLPRGGAVTALSLWINGVEEPGILTTKSKANDAYTTIVGRERRDPAVVFWQEGDQVRVRVFPVTRDMPRKFRIGVTAPLRLENQTLQYDNISFDGPPALLATERDSVFFADPALFADVPALFEKKQHGDHYSLWYEGVYRHTWSVTCQALPVARPGFSFDGKTYLAKNWRPDFHSFNPTLIYIDANAAWTHNEWETLRTLAGPASVQVYLNGAFHSLTDANEASLFRQLHAQRFSLFPFHKIPANEPSLVVTKSADATPLPSELAGSPFADGMQAAQNADYLPVFHLGEDQEMNAYLRALREKRRIFCVSGDLETLKNYLQSHKFPQNPENENCVALPEAGLLIQQKDTTLQGAAPDHLFRLFAYNTVLRELRGRTETASPELIRLAEQAGVVTPVTSLITLESKADYERFNIQPTAGLNTLGNAGAVPEPHEWALIALLVLSVIGLRFLPAKMG